MRRRRSSDRCDTIRDVKIQLLRSNRVDSHAIRLTRAVEITRSHIAAQIRRIDARTIVDPSYDAKISRRVNGSEGESFIAHFAFVKFSTSQERYYRELRREVRVSRAIAFCPIVSSNSR